MRQGAKACGYGSRGATARGARGAVELPRIATRRPDEIVAHVLVPVVGGVGFANHNAPCSFDTLGDHTIDIRNVVLEEFRAIRAAQTSTGFEVFNGDWQPMQWLQ